MVGGSGDALGGVGGMLNCVCDGSCDDGCGGCVPGGEEVDCGGASSCAAVAPVYANGSGSVFWCFFGGAMSDCRDGDGLLCDDCGGGD
eukprot:12285981-Karenia_brevis.AAC.1